MPGAAGHGLSRTVTLPVAVTLAISVTFADALAEPLRDANQPGERGNGVAFVVEYPPADASGPVLAVAFRDLCLALRDICLGVRHA